MTTTLDAEHTIGTTYQCYYRILHKVGAESDEEFVEVNVVILKEKCVKHYVSVVGDEEIRFARFNAVLLERKF
jgi:hypothetical protein